MPTNLAIDDRLIEQARRAGRHKTKIEAMAPALEEYIKRRKQLAILNLAGAINYDPKYEYKAARKRKRG